METARNATAHSVLNTTPPSVSPHPRQAQRTARTARDRHAVLLTTSSTGRLSHLKPVQPSRGSPSAAPAASVDDDKAPTIPQLPISGENSTMRASEHAHTAPGLGSEEENGLPSNTINRTVPTFPSPQALANTSTVSAPSSLQSSTWICRRAPLGPPPSARRGPDTYYPRSAHVTPIVEETDSQRGSQYRGSFASSSAMPVVLPEHDIPDVPQCENDDDPPFADPVGQSTLTPVGSMDDLLAQGKSKHVVPTGSGVRLQAALPSLSTNFATREQFSHDQDVESTRVSAINMLKRSTSNRMMALSAADHPVSEKHSEGLRLAQPRHSRAKSRPLISPEMVASNQSVCDPEKDAQRLKVPMVKDSLAKRIGSRRPPPINVDAVKEAEARGSLTSLPDLIKRAMQLASNLDHGRTASKDSKDWFEQAWRRSPRSPDERQSGSLSGILASFPPPRQITRNDRKELKGPYAWTSNLGHDMLPSDSDLGERTTSGRKRYCGMPLQHLLLGVLAVVLLIAIAIIVPVFLLVVPRQRSGTTYSSATALSQCQTSFACSNSGTSMLSGSGACSCLCVNGYTGNQCTEQSDAACTTAMVRGSNLTMGSSIARLLDVSQKFGIALDGMTIAGLFSSANLSCSTENALVTFNGLSSRSMSTGLIDAGSAQADLPRLISPRQISSAATTTATSSNGIVYESGTPTATSPISSSISTSATSTSTAAASSDSSTLDFARVAVLYVLQTSGHLNDAITAQCSLQDFFTTGTTTTGQVLDAKNITLCDGYTANLEKQQIVLSNGTTV